MKNIIKLFTFFTITCLSLPGLAAENCDPNFDPYCGNGNRGGIASLAKAGEILVLGSAVALGVSMYIILSDDTKDPRLTARIMADYHNGKGLRLTSYDNILNVSLFKPKPYIVRDPLSNVSNQYKLDSYSYNLVSVSLHW